MAPSSNLRSKCRVVAITPPSQALNSIKKLSEFHQKMPNISRFEHHSRIFIWNSFLLHFSFDYVKEISYFFGEISTEFFRNLIEKLIFETHLYYFIEISITSKFRQNIKKKMEISTIGYLSSMFLLIPMETGNFSEISRHFQP